MTISMPAAGRGPGLLIVGGRPDDAVFFAGRGLVAGVVGLGHWEPALAQLQENPVVEGRTAVWCGGRVWMAGGEEQAEEAANRWAVVDFLSRV